MKRTAVLALIWIALILAVAGLASVAKKAVAGDYAQFEGQMRAAAIQHSLHRDACLAQSQAQRPLCFAHVNAELSKALANVQASYRDTTAEWAASERVAREADARVRRIEAIK